MFGEVAAVCSSPVGNIPKYPQPFATMAKWGLEGDFHNRELRPSFSKRGTFKPNTDRHISLVAIEVIEGMGKLLGRELGPGALGENITTRGLGNLSQIPDGTLLTIGIDVVLRVSQQNNPCKNVLDAYGTKAFKWVARKRGLLCSIEQGFGQTIRPREIIAVTF